MRIAQKNLEILLVRPEVRTSFSFNSANTVTPTDADETADEHWHNTKARTKRLTAHTIMKIDVFMLVMNSVIYCVGIESRF